MNTNNKAQQLELFETDEVESYEVPHKTTIHDLIRELKSLYVEVDISLDHIFDGDLERTKETLETLAERLEKFIDNIHP
jgi:broad specificity phosphatase PhoE